MTGFDFFWYNKVFPESSNEATHMSDILCSDPVISSRIMVHYLASLEIEWANPFGVRGLAETGFRFFCTSTPISLIV